MSTGVLSFNNKPATKPLPTAPPTEVFEIHVQADPKITFTLGIYWRNSL